MKKERPNGRRGAVIFSAGLFMAVFVFYFAAHPLPLLDTDDWSYVAYARVAVPSPSFWNPSRVLPELLMPLCGILTAVLNALFFHDYVTAQVFTVALVFSLFITAYLAAFRRLLERRLALDLPASMLMTLLFLLLHFLIFRHAETGNRHLFYTVDVVCVFFYTIPALLCAALVMWDLADDIYTDFFAPDRLLRKAFLLLLTYLAVFSNLYGSGILAVYAGCRLLFRLIRTLREKKPLSGFFRGELPRLLLLALWLLAALCEMMGGRAAISLGEQLPLTVELPRSMAALWRLCGEMNWLFLILLGGAALLTALLFFTRRKEETSSFALLGLLLCTWLLCSLFILLLCSVVSPDYANEPDASFGCFFYLLLLLCLAPALALKRRPRLLLLLPLALVVIFSTINTKSLTFADQNCLGVSARTVMAMDRDLIAQMREADAAGLTEAVLVTMDTDNDYDNWPQSVFTMGDAMADLLWKHGVTGRRLHITLQPSREFNERYGLVFPSPSP